MSWKFVEIVAGAFEGDFKVSFFETKKKIALGMRSVLQFEKHNFSLQVDFTEISAFRFFQTSKTERRGQKSKKYSIINQDRYLKYLISREKKIIEYWAWVTKWKYAILGILKSTSRTQKFLMRGAIHECRWKKLFFCFLSRMDFLCNEQKYFLKLDGSWWRKVNLKFGQNLRFSHKPKSKTLLLGIDRRCVLQATRYVLQATRCVGKP